ncbi:MAG: hypothetical protein H6573_06530 [Lewinellaceae bacterium]|nr:hypothetical protein [Lewinellaceae bacterium]
MSCLNVTIHLDADGNGSTTLEALNGGASDACGTGFRYRSTGTEFECTDVGVNTITLTATDVNGNAATCNATVTVIDNIPPVPVLPGYYGTARRQWQRHDHGFRGRQWFFRCLRYRQPDRRQ